MGDKRPMGRYDEIRFGAAASLMEMQGKTVLEIWQNIDGVEFVYAAENGNKSLTLRGEVIYFWNLWIFTSAQIMFPCLSQNIR